MKPLCTINVSEKKMVKKKVIEQSNMEGKGAHINVVKKKLTLKKHISKHRRNS
jgi:hypothetical protein